MERTMLSFNIPNLVTVNLMAWAGFLLFILLFQLVAKKRGNSSSSTTANGETVSAASGGY